MSQLSFDKLLEWMKKHQIELVIAFFMALPFAIFYMIGLMVGNLSVVDPSYWMSFLFYNVTIGLGLLFLYSRRQVVFSRWLLVFVIGLSVIILFAWIEIAFSGDITLGVIDGARLINEGKNPYIIEEVRHADGQGGFRLTTYPYLPVDLLVYSFILGLLNSFSSIIAGENVPSYLPGFNAMGILIANIIFMLISIVFIKKIFLSDNVDAALIGLSMFIILLWNNVCLCMMLFLIGWYFYKQENIVGTILFWSLSMLSKYFTGIFLVALAVEFFKQRNWVRLVESVVIPIVLGLVTMIPFGLIETLKSTVFFYSSAERSLDGSLGGSLVSEFAVFTDTIDLIGLYMFIGLGAVLLLCLYIKDIEERMIAGSLCSLLVISGMAAQFFTLIVFIFIEADQIQILSLSKDRTVGNNLQGKEN